jgi:glycerophosphoryl diester phosphodiesterase
MEIIAHRGDGKNHVENTAAAFTAALAAGADGIETDLRLSADGVIFLFHDDYAHRLCGRKGRIEAEPAAALREWRHADGQPLLSLDDFFALLRSLAPPGDFLVNLELKGTPKLQKQMAEILAKKFLAGEFPPLRFLVSSFKLPGLYALQELAPALPRALLWNGVGSFGLPLRRAGKLDAAAFHLENEAATPERLARLRKKVLPARIYTVNDPARGAELRTAGGAGIFTDDPSAMIVALRHNR